MKIITPLLGATISGGVAIIIFYMTKQKEENKKLKESKEALSLIKIEFNDNAKIYPQIKRILESYSPEDFAKAYTTSSAVAEKLSVITSKLSIELIENLGSNLTKDDYISISEEIKCTKKIINTLKLITSEIKEESNIATLIKLLSKQLDDILIFQKHVTTPIIEEIQDGFFHKLSNNLLFCTLIFIICSYVIIKIT